MTRDRRRCRHVLWESTLDMVLHWQDLSVRLDLHAIAAYACRCVHDARAPHIHESSIVATWDEGTAG